MVQWLKELDEVLRGHKGDPELLAGGTAHIHIKPLVAVSIVLGIVYGLFMGLYAVLTRTPPCFMQMFASAVKVPILFILTLIITFPSLYVFSALLGVRLGPKDTMRLILAPVAFLRSGAWGNAYVVVGRLILRAAQRLAPTPFLAFLWIATLTWLVALVVLLHHVLARRSSLRHGNQSPSGVVDGH